MSAPAGTRPSARPVRAAVRCGLALLSAALGVGTGHLVGGLVSPASAPVLAVADRVVGLTPPALSELAIATFGTADKIVLLAGVLVVLAAVALLAGGLSGRDERPGTAVLAVLGGLGLLAVGTGPAFGPLDLLAPAAALVVAVWTWRRCTGSRGGPPRPPPDRTWAGDVCSSPRRPRVPGPSSPASRAPRSARGSPRRAGHPRRGRRSRRGSPPRRCGGPPGCRRARTAACRERRRSSPRTRTSTGSTRRCGSPRCAPRTGGCACTAGSAGSWTSGSTTSSPARSSNGGSR